MAGEHVNHRRRMRERVRRTGLDQLPPHEVLEYLLYHSIPRGDVNPLAHRLLNLFGTVSAVLHAPREELIRVEGVGESTVRMLHAAASLVEAYRSACQREHRTVDNLRDALGERPYELPARPALAVYCFDQDGCLLGSERFDWSEPFLRSRRMVSGVLGLRAHSVLLELMNRREDYTMSEETWAEMRRVVRTLALLEVRVIDVMTRTPAGEASCRANGWLTETQTALPSLTAAEEDDWLADFSCVLEEKGNEDDPG